MKNILNRISKIISSAIFIILVIIIVLILAYVIRIKYLASQNRLGEVKLNFYTILTQSMVPTIYAGDVVVTYKNEDNHYNNGDIITFKSDLNGGINITHRIKETYKVNDQYSYKTKGDNNNTADNEIVKGERILGKVVLKIPKIGFFQQSIVKKPILIFLVIIPCLGVILYDILKMFTKGIKRREEDYIEFTPESYENSEFETKDEEKPLNQFSLSQNEIENNIINNSINSSTFPLNIEEEKQEELKTESNEEIKNIEEKPLLEENTNINEIPDNNNLKEDNLNIKNEEKIEQIDIPQNIIENNYNKNETPVEAQEELVEPKLDNLEEKPENILTDENSLINSNNLNEKNIKSEIETKEKTSIVSSKNQEKELDDDIEFL